MAAAPVFVPVEEYLQSSWSPDAEYIDGQIVERRARWERTTLRMARSI